MKTNNQLVGNIGLYYCCYKFSLLGWNVMPTSRNAKGIDIILNSQDTKRFLSVQVKALSKRSPVGLGRSGNALGDFWVILNYVASEQPVAYILTSEEVEALKYHNTKDGVTQYWLDPPRYCVDGYREKWERIGSGI